VSEAKAEAERSRSSAQRQVDELTRQRDSITSHLAQLRQLLGGAPLPSMEEPAPAVAAPAPKPALAATSSIGHDKPVTASAAPASRKSSTEPAEDAEWWQE